MQTETGVDTLVEDAAQLAVAFDNQNFFYAGFPRGEGCRQTCGAAPDNYNIIFHHGIFPF